LGRLPGSHGARLPRGFAGTTPKTRERVRGQTRGERRYGELASTGGQARLSNDTKGQTSVIETSSRYGVAKVTSNSVRRLEIAFSPSRQRAVAQRSPSSDAGSEMVTVDQYLHSCVESERWSGRVGSIGKNSALGRDRSSEAFVCVISRLRTHPRRTAYE